MGFEEFVVESTELVWAEDVIKSALAEETEPKYIGVSQMRFTNTDGFAMSSGTRPPVVVNVPANLRKTETAHARPYKVPKIGFAV